MWVGSLLTSQENVRACWCWWRQAGEVSVWESPARSSLFSPDWWETHSLSSPVKQNVGLLWLVTGWGGSIKTESEEMMYEVIDRVGNVPPAREESCKWHNWSLSDTDTGTIPRGGSGQGLLSPLSPGTLCRFTSWSGGSNSRSICLLQRGNILPASFTWLQLRSVSLSLFRQ